MNPGNQLRLNFMFHCFGKLFIAGTKAKGILRVHTLNETTIKRIKVGIIGKIVIESDENDNPTTIEKVFYSSGDSNEEHIFETSDVIQSTEEEQLLEFAVPLDNSLPPSIMMKQGGIIYYLYASMEETFNDGTIQHVNTEANVSVVNIKDCNLINKGDRDKIANKAPVGFCLCLQSQEQGDTLQISPRAYVPGDCIKINGVVFNPQSYTWCYVQVALVQKMKLKLEEHMVRTERVVSETKRGPCVKPQEPHALDNQLLRIPPLPPTTYRKHSSPAFTLTLKYKLQLRVPGKQNVNDLSALLSVPVEIGNIPLKETLQFLKPLPMCETFVNKLLPIQKPYQEYARVERCIQVEEGQKFVPSYITYASERAMDNIDLEGSTPV